MDSVSRAGWHDIRELRQHEPSKGTLDEALRGRCFLVRPCSRRETAGLPHHEVTAEILLGCQRVVSPAAQTEIGDGGGTPECKSPFVVQLQGGGLAAPAPLGIHVAAPAAITFPHGSTHRAWDMSTAPARVWLLLGRSLRVHRRVGLGVACAFTAALAVGVACAFTAALAVGVASTLTATVVSAFASALATASDPALPSA